MLCFDMLFQVMSMCGNIFTMFTGKIWISKFFCWMLNTVIFSIVFIIFLRLTEKCVIWWIFFIYFGHALILPAGIIFPWLWPLVSGDLLSLNYFLPCGWKTQSNEILLIKEKQYSWEYGNIDMHKINQILKLFQFISSWTKSNNLTVFTANLFNFFLITLEAFLFINIFLIRVCCGKCWSPPYPH